MGGAPDPPKVKRERAQTVRTAKKDVDPVKYHASWLAKVIQRWSALLLPLLPLAISPAGGEFRARDRAIRVPLRRVAAALGSAAPPVYRAAPFNPSQELHAFGGVQWLGLLELGEPRQRFTVTMDTGSSDLLVIGHDCHDQQCEARVSGVALPKAKYDSSRSTRFLPCHTNRTVECSFKEDYGGGHATGVLGFDVAVLAGLRTSSFEFGIIKSLSMEGAGLRAWDGILGLTFDNLEAGRPKTLLSVLYTEGALAARQLTFLLMDPAAGGDSDPFQQGDEEADDRSMLELGGMTMVEDTPLM
jgi:hypothetical protein